MSKRDWEKNFKIGDYEPRRSSRVRVEPTEEERIAHCLDFIKTNLDTALYNQYAKNLNNQDFVELLRVVDSKIMPKFLTLLSNSEEIAEVRKYLIAPILTAAKNGNGSAILALNRPADPTLYVIDPTEYSRKAQKIFEQNSDLLQNIGISLNTNDAPLFHDASRYLISRISRSGISEDEQLKLMNQLERLSSRFSIKQEAVAADNALVDRAAFSADIPDSIGSEMDSAVATSSNASVTRPAFSADISDSIGSEMDSAAASTTMVDRSTARPSLIRPEKYDEEITTVLLRHKNLLGLFNGAIADQNFEKLRYYGQALKDKLQVDLSEEKYHVILHDMANISRTIKDNTKDRAI